MTQSSDEPKFPPLPNLTSAREAKNLTQDVLSEKTKLSQPRISNLETGAGSPKIWELLLLANELDTSTDYILGRTNDSRPIRQASEVDIMLIKITQIYNALKPEQQRELYTLVQTFQQIKLSEAATKND